MVARIKKLRTGLLALCCLVSLGLGGELALAESAAPSYNYSYWGMRWLLRPPIRLLRS